MKKIRKIWILDLWSKSVHVSDAYHYDLLEAVTIVDLTISTV